MAIDILFPFEHDPLTVLSDPLRSHCTLPLMLTAFFLSVSVGARHGGGIGLSYRHARLHRLAEFIPWNRFLGSINI